MAFKISSSRPKKLQKCIAAFDDTGEDDSSLASSSKAAAEAMEVSAQVWIDKGSSFAEAGDLAAALRCWDQAALIHPSNANVHEMRAQVLNDLNRTYEAVQAAQQAVKLKPDWPEAHITLARVQLNLGEPQLALLSYQAAAKLQPGHPDLAQELPAAQMYAKLHRQQPTGTRAHVLQPCSDTAAARAATEHLAQIDAAAAGDGTLQQDAAMEPNITVEKATVTSAAEVGSSLAEYTAAAAAADSTMQAGLATKTASAPDEMTAVG